MCHLYLNCVLLLLQTGYCKELEGTEMAASGGVSKVNKQGSGFMRTCCNMLMGLVVRSGFCDKCLHG